MITKTKLSTLTTLNGDIPLIGLLDKRDDGSLQIWIGSGQPDAKATLSNLFYSTPTGIAKVLIELSNGDEAMESVALWLCKSIAKKMSKPTLLTIPSFSIPNKSFKELEVALINMLEKDELETSNVKEIVNSLSTPSI